jgi:L-rhamnose mutarotase
MSAVRRLRRCPRESGKTSVPQIALHTVLKPGRETDYDAVHRSIPTELATALIENGVSDWRIWRSGQHVFHVVDVRDYHAMRAGLRDLPANVAWQEQIAPLFEVADDYAGDDDGLPFVWSLSGQVAAMKD